MLNVYICSCQHWWKGQSRAICDISSLTPAQFTAWQEQRYTQDDQFNPVELTQDIPGYIHHMFLVPELGVVLAHRGMLQELRAVLSVPGAQPQLFLYNTTYNLGGISVCHQWFLYTCYLRKHQSHQQHFFFTREGLSLPPPPHAHTCMYTHILHPLLVRA